RSYEEDFTDLLSGELRHPIASIGYALYQPSLREGVESGAHGWTFGAVPQFDIYLLEPGARGKSSRVNVLRDPVIESHVKRGGAALRIWHFRLRNWCQYV